MSNKRELQLRKWPNAKLRPWCLYCELLGISSGYMYLFGHVYMKIYPIENLNEKKEHIWFAILISLIRANDIDGLIKMELSFHHAKDQMDFLSTLNELI